MTELEPDMADDAPPIIEQALGAVDHMDPDDWVGCALADEVKDLREQLVEHQRASRTLIEQRRDLEEALDRCVKFGRQRLKAVLEAIGADALRDWDDAINAVECIERERRYLKVQADHIRELASQATVVLRSNPVDCTGVCYEGPDCNCSGIKVSRAWDLDPEKVLNALSGASDWCMLPWDNLLNTVFELKRQLDESRERLSEQNSQLIKLFGLATPEAHTDVMAKVYGVLALDDTPTTVKRKDLREIVEQVLAERANEGVLPDEMVKKMKWDKGTWKFREKGES